MFEHCCIDRPDYLASANDQRACRRIRGFFLLTLSEAAEALIVISLAVQRAFDQKAVLYVPIRNSTAVDVGIFAFIKPLLT